MAEHFVSTWSDTPKTWLLVTRLIFRQSVRRNGSLDEEWFDEISRSGADSEIPFSRDSFVTNPNMQLVTKHYETIMIHITGK